MTNAPSRYRSLSRRVDRCDLVVVGQCLDQGVEGVVGVYFYGGELGGGVFVEGGVGFGEFEGEHAVGGGHF